MSKAALVIAAMPSSCVECCVLYGQGAFCGGGGLVNRAVWNPLKERSPACPLIELPAEIKPEDCEIIERDGSEKFTEEEKELIAAGTAHGWNSLLDILTEGEGSEDED